MFVLQQTWKGWCWLFIYQYGSNYFYKAQIQYVKQKMLIWVYFLGRTFTVVERILIYRAKIWYGSVLSFTFPIYKKLFIRNFNAIGKSLKERKKKEIVGQSSK